jgi:hypothetical protein
MKILRTQYIVGYKPTEPGQAKVYRKVTVNLVEGSGQDGWSVTTRAGYLVPEKQ